jgi:hypothetical protein
MPLGSLTELLTPPTLPGPAGTPLTPVVPAPAEPAFGVPTALPEPAAAPDAPAFWANELTDPINVAATAIAIVVEVFDIGFSWLIPIANGAGPLAVPRADPISPRFERCPICCALLITRRAVDAWLYAPLPDAIDAQMRRD